jgi:hypothetical protein
MSRPIAVAMIALSCLCAASRSAAAQDSADPPALFVRMTMPAATEWRLPGRVGPAERGSVLPALYVSLAGLQAYDGYSTGRGLRSGASEANTVLGTLANHPAALWAVKGGTGFVSIYVAERLWRGRHRGQAIALMVVSNGIMAAVAASNASIIQAQR